MVLVKVHSSHLHFFTNGPSFVSTTCPSAYTLHK